MTNNDKHSDVIVIGGGSGGLAFAKRAADNGARVMLVERAELGGTCVNRGCVPKKLMWELARRSRSQQALVQSGLTAPSKLDFGKFVSRRDAHIQSLNQNFIEELHEHGVTLIRGEAKIENSNSVIVDGQNYKCDRIVIATGARPNLLDIDGSQFIETSNDLFHWSRLPDRCLIVGGGYIGCEFAAILSALGTDVTLVTNGDRLLKKFDGGAVEKAAANLEHAGVRLVYDDTLKSVCRGSDRLQAALSSGDTIETDNVLVAIGRSPNVDGLGDIVDRLRRAKSGAFAVDERLETSEPGIFALGDVADRLPLTPVATRDGTALADRLFGDGADLTDLHYVATTTFLYPPIAQVGLTQEEAAEQHRSFSIRASESGELSESVLSSDDDHAANFHKVLTNTETGNPIGVSLIADGADDMIAFAATTLAVSAGKPASTATGVHPSFAEEVLGDD